MNKRYQACMVAVICTAALGLSGCTKATDKTVTIHGQKIPTLYEATGEERKITAFKTSMDKGKTLTYGSGDVLSDDVISYLLYLQDNEEYVVVDGYDDDNDSDVEKKMAVAKNDGTDHYYYVGMDWKEDGATTISYQYAKGTVTLYGDDDSDSSDSISESAPYESFDDDTAEDDSYNDIYSDSYSDIYSSSYWE